MRRKNAVMHLRIHMLFVIPPNYSLHDLTDAFLVFVSSTEQRREEPPAHGSHSWTLHTLSDPHPKR